jgi:hypothetical protein
MLDELANRLVHWSTDHPWRMCQILILLITLPCWISQVVP